MWLPGSSESWLESVNAQVLDFKKAVHLFKAQRLVGKLIDTTPSDLFFLFDS